MSYNQRLEVLSSLFCLAAPPQKKEDMLEYRTLSLDVSLVSVFNRTFFIIHRFFAVWERPCATDRCEFRQVWKEAAISIMSVCRSQSFPDCKESVKIVSISSDE